MKPKIIAVLNQKGGVGKTTTSVNLSVCLALKGLSTCIIDLDPQANASEDLGALDWSGTLSNHIMNINDSTSKKMRSELNLFSYDVPGGKPLTVFPSDIDLETVAIYASTITYKEAILLDFIQSNPFTRDTDYIIIDCPPSLNVLTVNAIYCATNFLIPIDCSRHALKGMASLLKSISTVKRSNVFDNFWILLNEVDQREKIINNVILNQISVNGLSEKVLRTQIKNLSSINKSIFRGSPIALTDDIGSQCFLSLTDEILERCSNDKEVRI